MTQWNRSDRQEAEVAPAATPPRDIVATVAPPVPAFLSLEQLLQVPVTITYVAGVFPARSETFVYREVRALRQRGWNVTAVSLNEPPDAGAADFADLNDHRLIVYGAGLGRTLRALMAEVFNHPLCTGQTFFAALADAIAPGEPTPLKARFKLIAQATAGIGLAGRLRDGGTRHIHCHFAHAPTTLGMYAAMQLRVPFSFTGHANDLFQRRMLLTRKLERATFVACISRWHRDFYRQRVPADEAVYPIVRCGVDVQAWNVKAEDGGWKMEDGKKVAAPSSILHPPSSPLKGILHVLTVCRLVEKKGVDVLLRAMADFGQSNHRSWRLTIAGDGPESVRLRQLAAELGVADQVEFLGAVDNERVRELLKSADLFVLACRTDAAGDRDGIPVVLTEAMASGVSVISGDLPAIHELVEPGVAGLLVNGGDVAALTEAITKLANNRPLRESLAAGGRAAVEREFALDLNITRLEQWLEHSLRPPHPRLGRLRQARAESKTANIMRMTDATEIHRTDISSVSTTSRRYALITPCRDEAKYARRTLDSVTRQTIPPAIWVIVDDGSKDETPQILAEYAAKFPFIRIVTRADRGVRKLGGGVIDAFYSGYETLNPADYDYICKFDLDLDLPCRYFEGLMERMEQNPRIGTCSGKPYYVLHGQPISEKCGDENSVGMIKFYRTRCFEQIGGFVRELMWDGIDCHRCRMKGWIAISWDDPTINFEHLRPMGTSHKNWWTGRVRHGTGQYFMGTGPIYMLASSIFRMTRPPLVVGGIAMFWGYLRSAIQRRPRYDDREFRRFLRRYQWSCLLGGKAKATARLDQRQAAVFSA
jgi:glycosyltransferase involved in cell wall biosynthesis